MSGNPKQLNQAQLVECVLALTEAIDEASRIADWERAAQLAEQRSPLLRSFSPKQDAAALQMIRRIQAMDAALLENARTASSELTAEYQAAMTKLNAASQYQRAAFF
jgi:flagellar protein FliT